MKKKKNKIIISIVVGLVVLIIVTIVIINAFFAKKELTTLKLQKEDVYIYFSEEKFDFKGNITLDYDDNITSITLDGKKTKLYNEPIYYSKKDELILPVNYSITFPASAGKQNKVNYYTSVKKIDDAYYLVGKKLNFNITNDFLFDGRDFYIFVNASTVNFGENEVNISPLSYVNYIYNTKDLYIYNYDEDKLYYYENVNDTVYVTNDIYKVNLSADSVIINDKNKLLMKNFDYLKKLK